MKNFKISFDDVFLNGLTTFQVGCTVKYKCLCQQLGRKPDMKALKAVFTSRELKFVLDRFEVCSNFAQDVHEFVQNSPKFVQSLHEVCSKKDNQNNNITQKNENTSENFLNECCKKQESEQKEEKKNSPLNPQKENNKNIYPPIKNPNGFFIAPQGAHTPPQQFFDEKEKVKKFYPPTVEEVSAYCEERQNAVDPERFVDFYSSKGWMVGKNKMKDWHAAVRTWERSSRQDDNSDEEFYRKLEAL